MEIITIAVITVVAVICSIASYNVGLARGLVRGVIEGSIPLSRESEKLMTCVNPTCRKRKPVATWILERLEKIAVNKFDRDAKKEYEILMDSKEPPEDLTGSHDGEAEGEDPTDDDSDPPPLCHRCELKRTCPHRDDETTNCYMFEPERGSEDKDAITKSNKEAAESVKDVNKKV
jgi:hypothetical protein